MINLNRLECFVAIVDSGSFTRAAEMLGLTKAMVSVQLKKLESELGIALITRTTRRLALTEVGEQFYQDCVRVVREAEAAVDSARTGHAALSGVLRLTYRRIWRPFPDPRAGRLRPAARTAAHRILRRVGAVGPGVGALRRGDPARPDRRLGAPRHAHRQLPRAGRGQSGLSVAPDAAPFRRGAGIAGLGGARRFPGRAGVVGGGGAVAPAQRHAGRAAPGRQRRRGAQLRAGPLRRGAIAGLVDPE